jgi:RHS repeat-associated protein
VQEIHRLAAIEVQQGGSAIRRYDLTYEAALSTTRKSRLASIEQCAGTLCRPTTTFTYQNGSVGLQGEVNTTQTVPAAVLTSFPLDVNGDGREDLVYVSSTTAGGTWRVMLANSSGGYGPPINSNQANTNYDDAIPIDYNQDGLGDVLVPYNGTHWYVMLGSASGLGTLTSTTTVASTTGRGANARALDIDGDGRQDLVYADLHGDFSAGDAIRYRPRNPSGHGFGAAINLVGPLAENSKIEDQIFWGWANQQPQKAPDFNGDGRGDIVYQQVTRVWHPLNGWMTNRAMYAKCPVAGCYFAENLPSGAGITSFGDFNGDGLTDLFFYKGVGAGSWAYALSRGTDLAPAVSLGVLSDFTLNWVILDWDADGRDDVLAQVNPVQGGGWRLARANGLGLDPFVAVSGTFPTGPVPNAATTDIDGDGLHDFAYLQGGTWRYRKHAGRRPDLLTSVTDGYGNTVSITYAPLTSPGVHTKTTGAVLPEQEWQGPIMVVTRHTASDGIGGTYEVDHTYAGARLHLQGRGFEGFSRHTTTDDRNDVITHEYFMRLFPHTGSPDLAEMRQSDNTLIASSDFVWGAAAPPSGLESRTHPFPSKITEKAYGVGATLNGTLLKTMVTDTTMDAATGTPTEVKVTTTEHSGANGIRPGATWTERTVHTNLTNYTTGPDWCIGRPQRTEQINSNSTADGAVQTRTMATTWDPDFCRPTEQVLEPDISQWRLEVDLAYDGFGNLRLQTIGDGTGPLLERIWETTFTADGRFPLTVKNPLNEITQLSFDARFGLPASETDPNGLVTSFIYDGFGRATRETRPDSTRTDVAYAACGTGCGQTVTAQQKNTSGGVVRTDYTYFDDFDRLYATRTQLLGGGYSLVVREHDDLGRLKTESAPCPEGTPGTCLAGIFRTTYTYDLIGRPTQISRPFAAPDVVQTTTIAYAGLRTTITDPLNKLSVRTEDARGRLARSADHAGYAQTFDYDAFGNPVRVSDSTSTLQTATFNIRGLRETATDADLGTWEYTYNAFGEPTAHTDANEVTTEYQWDALGRPTERKMPEGAGFITRTWTWGELGDNTASAKYVGRLKESKVTGTGVHTYREVHGYDAKGRPAQTEYWQNSTSIGQVSLAYDATTGLVDSLTYPESTAQYRLKLKYDYEGGFLKRVKDFNAPTTVFWEATTMDAYGQIIDETLGGVLKTIRGVEPRTGFTESIQSGPLADPVEHQNLEYVWDKAGNLMSRKDHNRALLEEFTYDNLHRMTNIELNNVGMASRTYASNGNIASLSTLGTFTYHPVKLHAVSSTAIAGGATQTYGYDANGNMTDRNGQQLLWFADNRLKRVRKNPGSAANSSEFQYGPDGQRWYHKYNDASTIYTHVNLGGLFEIVTRGAIDDFRHTIHANGVPVALYSRKSTGANTLRYLLRDHVGSVSVIATGTGTEELSMSYFGFGGRRDPDTWSGAPPSADVTALREITRRGFTDHEHLDQLNPDLIHMNGRVYDPQLTRFVSADPFIDGITNTQGWNRYSYVGNNPLSYVDPSGYLTIPSTDVVDGNTGPDGLVYNNCQSFGYGISFCVSGSGYRDNARFNDYYNGRGTRTNWLTDEQREAIARGRAFAKGGTVNFMGHLAKAPTGEDFTGSTVGRLGQGFLNAVPGAYYAGQSQIAFGEGRYLLSAGLYAAALGDAALGVFTFGQGTALTGSVRAGTATIYQYGARHTSIAVRLGDEALHTEQIILANGSSTTIAEATTVGVTRAIEVALPDARAALQYQRSVLGTATGEYNLATNSCLTHCGDVLRAGGVFGVPSDTRGIIRWLRSVFGD